MVQWLVVFTALAKDPGLIPAPTLQPVTIYNYRPRRYTAPILLSRVLYAHGAQTCKQIEHPYTQSNNL